MLVLSGFTVVLLLIYIFCVILLILCGTVVFSAFFS
jgi:hypothetical protein